MTEEEIAAIAAKHRMAKFPNLALTRERLSRKAKAEPKFRFYTLYGRVMDMETLRCAWRCVRKVKKASGVDGAFYSVGYPSRVFRKVNHYVLKRMARFLNRKSQRYYRLKFADTYYGEMTHYGLYRLAWADVRRAR